MTKQELRKVYKEKRSALTGPQRMKMDDLLLIQLQRIPFGFDSQVLLSYFPLEHHSEINVHLFTRYLEHICPQLRIAYPVADFATGDMKAVATDDNTRFEENSYGIPEPVDGEEVLPRDIDIVWVPLLAFDRKGFRVGYGKGFYDRFLKHCRHDVLRVGFSYFEPVDTIGDAGEFDVPLDLCVTPERLYEF